MKNGKYEYDASGLFNNLPDALDALHEMCVVMAELLYTNIAEDEDDTLTVADIIGEALLSSLEIAASAMHYHSCVEAREQGIVKPDGTFDTTKGLTHGKDKIVADDGPEEEQLIPLNEAPAQVPESMQGFLNDLLKKKGF